MRIATIRIGVDRSVLQYRTMFYQRSKRMITVQQLQQFFNLKHFAMKFKLGVAVIALVVSIGFAFGFYGLKQKPALPDAKATGYFYRYVLTTYTEAQIKDISNYVRSEVGCEPGEHVCGVILPTDTGSGQQPNSTEFDAVKNDLWSSEVNGAAQLTTISMRE